MPSMRTLSGLLAPVFGFVVSIRFMMYWSVHSRFMIRQYAASSMSSAFTWSLFASITENPICSVWLKRIAPALASPSGAMSSSMK